VIPDLGSLTIGDAYPGKLSFTYRDLVYTLHLSGVYQVRNALTAIEALRLLPSLGYAMTENAIVQGLSAAQFPARFEVLSQHPPILLDGAHNVSGMEALAENIDFYYSDRSLLYLCGMLRDKNPEEALAPILRAGTVRFCACITPPSPRAMQAETLCEIFRAHGIEALPYPTIEEALHALTELRASMCSDADIDDLPILCFGSLYSAGDVRRACGIFTETADLGV
jgi:dihydrofolate synthase/folylpolyglutamate synthase